MKRPNIDNLLTFQKIFVKIINNFKLSQSFICIKVVKFSRANLSIQRIMVRYADRRAIKQSDFEYWECGIQATFLKSRNNMDVINSDVVYLQNNIRILRKRMKLSQEELASKLGLNRGNIASYENGSAEPKICNLLKMAGLFEVSIFDLTQSDLSQEENYLLATATFLGVSNQQKQSIEQFAKQAHHLEQVIYSIHTCQKFKTTSSEEISEDLQYTLYNFKQMYEVACQLLDAHKELIEMTMCRCK